MFRWGVLDSRCKWILLVPKKSWKEELEGVLELAISEKGNLLKKISPRCFQ